MNRLLTILLTLILAIGKIGAATPTAVAFTDSDKSKSYWYASNSSTAGTGYDELHINTVSPDLSKTGISDDMSFYFSDAFANEHIELHTISGFDDSQAILDFVFSSKNTGSFYGTYNGSVVSYTLSVSSDGKTLYATRNGSSTKEAVAIISGTSINSQKITYQRTASAEALLNYASSTSLTDKVLKALIELKVNLNDAAYTAVTCTGNTFYMRFIRPINVTALNAEITNGKVLQTLDIADLVKITDRNGVSFSSNTSYWKSYNIKSIQVLGSTSGNSCNKQITTDYANSDISNTVLTDVTDDLLFICKYTTYDAEAGNDIDLANINFGYITFQNYSSDFSTFKVRIPIAVEYEWGTQVVYAYVTVTEPAIPSAVAFTDDSKISNYWYKSNTAYIIGYDEIHVQTLSPEDYEASKIEYARDLTWLFSNVFVDNKIELASYSSNGNTESYTTRLVFSSQNTGKVYKGYNGNSVVGYTLSVSDDGLTLYAAYKGTTQAIAILTNSDDINKEEIVYQKTDYAFALLNYAAHNQLTDDVLKATIEMKVQTPTLDVPCTDNTFDVRFLRPLNAKTQELDLRKGTSATYKIPMTDLINDLTDWRDYSFSTHPHYYNYYNIKSIKVFGSTSGLAINKYVNTDMNDSDISNTRLSDVTDNVLLMCNYKTYDFTSSAKIDINDIDFGYITYQNFSSVDIAPFTVRIPLAIEYEWGTLYAYSDVKFDTFQQVSVTGISLSESTHTLTAGDSFTLTASISPVDATNTSVTWTSSNTSVATVSSTGKVTGVGKGTATITATSADNSGVFASCTVTVSAVQVSSVTFNVHSLSATYGDSPYTIIASVLPENALNQTLTWTSSNSMVASVDQNGKVTFAGVGTAKITATTTDGSNISDVCTVTVNPLCAESITVSPSSASLEVNEKLTLKATIRPTNATYKDVAWSTSDKTIATVSENGVVTAVQPGEATIYARTTDGSSLSATCRITVNRPKVTGVTLSSQKAELYEGETLQLTATVSPSDAANKTLTWTSADESVATVSDGLVTAIKAGSTSIVATSTDGSNISAACQLTVKPILVSSVSFPQSTVYVEKDASVELNISITPANASSTTMEWSSSDNNVATVTDGVVTGVNPGAAIITARTTDGSNLTAQCIVIVQLPDAIQDITACDNIDRIFTIDGRQVNRLGRGTYIIILKDGTRKIVHLDR